MKNNNPVYLLFVAFAMFLISPTSLAQVGIGTVTPNTNALLDVDATSTNGGILLPRLGLTSTVSFAPLTSHVAGMIIYNTATNGSGATAVSPGFYYDDGTAWIRLSAAASDDWKTTGNAGTTSGTNFIGTTDNVNFTIRRNDLERAVFRGSEIVLNPNNDDVNFRVRTLNSGNTFFIDGQYDNVGIGTLGTIATTKLEVDGGATDGIYGYSNNVGGYLGRETNISFGTPTQTLLGAGVYANNPNAGYTSTYSQSTGAADVAANINFSEVWIASYNYVENPSNTYNPSAIYAQLNVTGSSLGDYKSPITTYMNRGTTSGNPWYTVGLNAQSISQNEDAYGIRAVVFSDQVYDFFGEVSGAYFSAADYGGSGFSTTWVALYNGFTDYKVLGSGTVSTLIKDENNINRIMYAPEAPEVLFQDFGVGTLVNGRAEIKIDPIMSKNIAVDANHPLKVFIQLEGDCKGVFVTNKSKNGFTVSELQGGTSNIDFSWQIVANRKDRKGDSDFGDSNFQDKRLPKFIRKGGFKETIKAKDVSYKKRN